MKEAAPPVTGILQGATQGNSLPPATAEEGRSCNEADLQENIRTQI